MTEKKPQYNLLDEPWIHVVTSHGKKEALGITALLERAHELAEILEPEPIIEIGILRLLVAFVSDAFKIANTDGITKLLAAGRFDPSVLEEYSTPIRNRFDLFDEKAPFFQVSEADLRVPTEPVPTTTTSDVGTTASAETKGKRKSVKKAKEKEIERKSVAVLFQQVPSGTGSIHYFHALEDEHAVSPGACARALCTLPCFATAGGRKNTPSINKSTPLYAVIHGQSLFHTIVYNCCGVDLPTNIGTRPVAWRLSERVKQETMRDASTLQGLTWQPRIVHLYPSEGGRCTITGENSDVLVREVVFMQGWRSKEVASWTDPHVPYERKTKSKKKPVPGRKKRAGPMQPIKPRAERAIWRDTGPIMILTDEIYMQNHQRPAVVRQYVALKGRGIVEANEKLKVDVYAFRTKQMNFYEWQKESLELPFNIAADEWRGELVQEGMDAAEKIEEALVKALKAAYPRKGKGNRRAFGKAILRAKRTYWDRLEPLFTTELVGRVAALTSNTSELVEGVKDAWRATLRRVVFPVLHATLDTLGTICEAIERQVIAGRVFIKLVKKQLFKPRSAPQSVKIRSIKRRNRPGAISGTGS
ncbi:MAG: type I-E CRISPR-associated protein Cse1/CasA [Candidatus Sigynarchaeota archaeon]